MGLYALTRERLNKESGEWKHLDDNLERGEGKWLGKISYASGKFEVRRQSNNAVALRGEAVGLQTVLVEAEAVFRAAKKQASIQSGASYLSQGFEDNVLGSSPG